jgi:chemotaxis response regulator CheB
LKGAAIEPIRIVLVDLSRLVADLVERAVERQPDMVVVARAERRDVLLELGRATEPDVVVVGLHGAGLPGDCLELLLERPRMSVLGIEAHDGRAWLYVLRPQELEIGEVSPEDVVETIRSAAGWLSPI